MPHLEVECPTLRDCRRAEILANVLKRGAGMLRKAHRRFGCDPEIKAAVEACLKDDLKDRAAKFRRLHGVRADAEQVNVEVSEHHVAIKQAMPILFPDPQED